MTLYHPMAPWRRIKSRNEFHSHVANRVLTAPGIRFMLGTDGRIRGKIDGHILRGAWVWSDGLFCRTTRLGGGPANSDREVIELRGRRMRYTREAGAGQSVEVSIK